MSKPLSVLQFFKQFPDDDTCLEHLMTVRYGKDRKLACPKCEKASKFHKVSGRPVYSCQFCGHQISPMAGTPFHRSSTPLQKWFYAIYLFTTTRHGVPAKELQRQLSVTYKTAWRMGHEIRKYMADVDGDPPLSGHLEVDETYVGGKSQQVGRPSRKGNKTAVLGVIERDGKVMTKVVKNAGQKALIPPICATVEKGSTISSDELQAYKKLRDHGYIHGYVKHSGYQWTKGIHHTNTLEGYWARLKLSIRGTHIHVSRKYLPNYLAEFEYRYNMRTTPSLMFDRLLASF
ncbi:MAG: IS1595 family transposase [Gammaproteobacteria bacterium]|nr:IS1595 family transposase [Gammaproteobacteria bacterium]|tara:strand:- start:142511 stop:143377 length:867 start_codon:yes stop_codon:yes gene_type:complete